MTVATFIELRDTIADWLDRDDLTSRIPTFLALVEAKLNRRLQDPEQDTVWETTAAGDYTDLPTDFGEMVSISTGEGPLSAMGAAEYAGIDETFVGTPRFYTIVERSIGFYPRNSTAEIRMVYRKKIPALTVAAPTNWLLTRAPDVYLYGALVEAYVWDPDEQAASGLRVLYEDAVRELLSDGTRRRWGAGPLAPRIRRT